MWHSDKAVPVQAQIARAPVFLMPCGHVAFWLWCLARGGGGVWVWFRFLWRSWRDVDNVTRGCCLFLCITRGIRVTQAQKYPRVTGIQQYPPDNSAPAPARQRRRQRQYYNKISLFYHLYNSTLLYSTSREPGMQPGTRLDIYP